MEEPEARVGVAAPTVGLVALGPVGSLAETAVVKVELVGEAEMAVGADLAVDWWGTEAPGGRTDTLSLGPG